MGTVTAQNYTHTIVGDANAETPANSLFVRNQTAITIGNIENKNNTAFVQTVHKKNGASGLTCASVPLLTNIFYFFYKKIVF